MSPDDSLRLTVALGIYDRKPFRTSSSGGVLEMMRLVREASWEEAPGWYRDECLDIADGVMARMLLDQEEEAAAAPAGTADAARRVA